MIAEVIVDIVNKQVNRSFDYIVPAYLENILKVGFRVKIPFARSIRTGFIIKLKENTQFESKLKEIIDVVDIYNVLNEEFICLAKYISINNFSFYANVLQMMIPQALKVKYKKVAILNSDVEDERIKLLFKKKELPLEGLSKEDLSLIYYYVGLNKITLDTKVIQNRGEKNISYLSLNPNFVSAKMSLSAKMIVDYFEECEEELKRDFLIDECGFSNSSIKTLIKNNVLIERIVEDLDQTKKDIIFEYQKVLPNEEQTKAINKVKLDNYKPYLIHGVTGSGKTLVYMELIERVIKNNKTAIMLVPEISLTPQITSLFLSRFKSDIAILHSRLSTKDRYISWKKIINNEVKIVVGARSAIFAPLKNLGIIIIDESHENSYIQQNNPRYSAIDVSLKRGKYNNCPVILGSATPKITDYYKALENEYELINLKNRANNMPLPKSYVVDMTEELKNGNKTVFSKMLEEKLIKTYKNNNQSILFLNRRGYSSFVMCRSCGSEVKCPSCDVTLTFHANTQSLKCHHCGYNTLFVPKCANCGSDKIRYVGSGTQKIVERINIILPQAKVLRLDLDSASKLSDYEEAFKSFKEKKADILVGTQMIAKGLDFENVTLVGIVNADLALSYPSYDAYEVAYDLIEPVSGRAGRKDKEGEVVIQTYKPNHYVIDCAKNHNYDRFYNFEIQNRKFTLMPPFSDMIEIMISSPLKDLSYTEALNITNALKSVAEDSLILGPAEATIFRVADKYRYTVQVRIVEDSILDKINYIYPLYQNKKDINISIRRL